MLTIFRRHIKDCKHRAKGRSHRHCQCPIHVEGTLNGAVIREALDLRSWEAAQRRVREMEIRGRSVPLLVEASKRFIEDLRRRKLSTETTGIFASRHFLTRSASRSSSQCAITHFLGSAYPASPAFQELGFLLGSLGELVEHGGRVERAGPFEVFPHDRGARSAIFRKANFLGNSTF
jgi:hypothetical protein